MLHSGVLPSAASQIIVPVGLRLNSVEIDGGHHDHFIGHEAGCDGRAFRNVHIGQRHVSPNQTMRKSSAPSAEKRIFRLGRRSKRAKSAALCMSKLVMVLA